MLNSYDYLIKTGEINLVQFKKIGFAAVTGAGEGFIRGAVASAISYSCKSGMLGEGLKNLSPGVIGVGVALTMNTLKNAVILAIGFFPRTLLMLMFTVGFWLACITFIRLMAPVLFLFGISLPCYVSCMLLGEVFRKLEDKNEENETQS